MTKKDFKKKYVLAKRGSNAYELKVAPVKKLLRCVEKLALRGTAETITDIVRGSITLPSAKDFKLALKTFVDFEKDGDIKIVGFKNMFDEEHKVTGWACINLTFKILKDDEGKALDEPHHIGEMQFMHQHLVLAREEIQDKLKKMLDGDGETFLYPLVRNADELLKYFGKNYKRFPTTEVAKAVSVLRDYPDFVDQNKQFEEGKAAIDAGSNFPGEFKDYERKKTAIREGKEKARNGCRGESLVWCLSLFILGSGLYLVYLW